MLLRRLTPGFFALACAAAIAACSTSTTTPSSGGHPGLGPNFETGTVYITNTTQHVVEIFTPLPAPSATPQYVIGGSNTTINGPQYLSFNGNKQTVRFQLQRGLSIGVDSRIPNIRHG